VEDVDPSAQAGRQGVEEVAPVDGGGRQIAPGAADRVLVDVRGVQVDVRHRGRDHRGDGATAAAEVDHHGTAGDRREGGEGLLGEQFGAPAGHEDAGRDSQVQPTELDPAEQVLQGFTGHPAGDQGVQLGRRPGGAQ
jgi:hypothetical protein